MKLQNNLTPGNSPLRSLSTTMKPENSSMLWDTKPLSALLASLPMGKLWALRAALCLVPALQMHRHLCKATKQTLLLLLCFPVTRHFGMALAPLAP